MALDFLHNQLLYYHKNISQLQRNLILDVQVFLLLKLLFHFHQIQLLQIFLDLMYIERYSMVMDLRIILMTIKTMISPGEMNSESDKEKY